jgi:hypothetical protein
MLVYGIRVDPPGITPREIGLDIKQRVAAGQGKAPGSADHACRNQQ